MRKTGLGKGVVSLSLVVTELLALDLLYYYWPKSNFLYLLLEGAEEFDLINITIVVHHF